VGGESSLLLFEATRGDDLVEVSPHLGPIPPAGGIYVPTVWRVSLELGNCGPKSGQSYASIVSQTQDTWR
jgi:hypothetical protein